MNSSPFCSHSMVDLRSILRGRPQAAASIVGRKDHPGISGTVRLYQANEGAIVFAQVSGLPQSDIPCRERVFGFHIHEGTDCSGNMDDPLADAMSHYNPSGCRHPHHAGDLPPLFGNNGLALSLFLTNRFSIDEVIGRTVMDNDRPADHLVDGNSGTKIACGVIQRITGFC